MAQIIIEDDSLTPDQVIQILKMIQEFKKAVKKPVEPKEEKQE